MKSIVKNPDSVIVTSGYQYPGNNTEILAALDIEQDYFCAFTEEHLTPGFARDVEHFDPTLKNTSADGYNNWFSASTRINRRKGSIPRWNRCQPSLYPTNPNLGTRLIYNNGHYIVPDPNDDEAKNLRDFLFLNAFGQPIARQAYINNLKTLLTLFQNDLEELKAFLLNDPNSIKYRTAINIELGIVL